jgi:hypothetical protein
VNVPVKSSPELLTLHAVRLKGMADDDEVAARFGLDPAAARENLLDFQAAGWVAKVDFAGTGGWTLTSAGLAENERQLAHELAVPELRSAVSDAYLEFLPKNDHTDDEWDSRVLDELSGLSHDLQGVCRELTSRLTRFTGYDDRFSAALARVKRGEHSWVTRPRVDSCHTVWMELHEDLLATLGIRRGAEPV